MISGKCIPSHDRQRLDCYFTQVLLAYQEDAASAAKNEAEMLRDLDKASTMQEVQKICKDKVEEDATLAKYNVNYKTLITAWRALCKGKPSKEGALAFFRTIKELDAKKCRVVINAWLETFTRNIDRWTSRRGPTGVCGVVQANTLRPHDLTKMKEPVGPILWTYETHRIYTRPDDKDDALFCSKKFSVQNDHYAWNAKGRSLLCEDFEVMNGIDDRAWEPWQQ